MALHEPSTPIHQAAKDGEIAVLNKASKKELNLRDEDGWTAVHWCAWSGHPEPLEIVLRRGGTPHKVDNKGCTPLHIASTYGNYEAIELLLEHKSNIFALDNRGLHPYKAAGLNKHIDCCRILDTLSVQLMSSNPDYVKSQQSKAIKELERRLAKAEKGEKQNPKARRFRLGSRKWYNSVPNVKQGEDDTFVLKNPNEKESDDEENGDEEDDEEDDVFDPNFISRSAKNTLRPIPKMTSGAMLNTFAGITKQRTFSSSEERHSAARVHPHTRPTQTSSNAIGSIMPINPTEYEIENDSPLVTFLHSVDAYETGGILLQEKMDMESLMLCSEEDLKSIGLALGPRKKIVSGLSRRASLLTSNIRLQTMSDTDL